MKDRLLLLLLGYSKICSPIQNNSSDNQHFRLPKSTAQHGLTWMKNQNSISILLPSLWLMVDLSIVLVLYFFDIHHYLHSPLSLQNNRCTEVLTKMYTHSVKLNWVIPVPLICTFNHVNVIYFGWNSSNAADCHSQSVFYVVNYVL